MPFPKKISYYLIPSNLNILRKETDAFIELSKRNPIISQTKSERASVFASVTIEAAMAFPMFLFAMVCLIYMMEIMATQLTIKNGLNNVAREIAASAYTTKVITPGYVTKSLVQTIGEEKVATSIIDGGDAGLDAWGSYMEPKTGLVHLKVQYKIKLPVTFFGVHAKTMHEEVRWKGWIGYVNLGNGDGDGTKVYITETGTVYHKSRACHYLDLSIRSVAAGNVGELRNQEGAKYYSCPDCGKTGSKVVYITDYGTRYHSSLGCSGLKRKIYEVSMSEVVGKGACSKCCK